MGIKHKMMEQISAPENLLLAWRQVRGNIPKYRRERSAGPDSISIADYEENLTTELNFLHDALMTGRYKPCPAAIFQIPKPGGGQRKIVVLNVSDRVAQRAAQQVLEPIWEPTFMDCSFGFRPGLSVNDAIGCAQDLRVQKQPWIVDGDITNCFPSLDHDVLMGQIRRRIHDQRVLRLIQLWLDIGIMASHPQKGDDNLFEKAHAVTNWVQQGSRWIFDQAADGVDPYQTDRYDYARYERPDDRGKELSLIPQGAFSQRAIARQLVTNGLMLGTGWARRKAGTLGKTALDFAKSPAGRRALKKSVLISTSLAGVAVAGAAAAIIFNRQAGPKPTGVIQGSPISPLFANIYLHLFDLMMRKRDHALVRYADDWLVLSASRREAEKAYKDAEKALARLHLQLNPEKTHIRHPNEKVKWLGGVIR